MVGWTYSGEANKQPHWNPLSDTLSLNEPVATTKINAFIITVNSFCNDLNLTCIVMTVPWQSKSYTYDTTHDIQTNKAAHMELIRAVQKRHSMINDITNCTQLFGLDASLQQPSCNAKMTGLHGSSSAATTQITC
ncbi:hypothetical protein BASA50_007035 [Batrachochytrium salamandrivorans]|uniref:Uncharacterized protein n=1 Tax=Batrachochytrium salamandrivorans TaxID=1357716 RepID=A0ABQ8F7X1_9FUNG|nr:hypothetical protein BASA60_006625 [Batrachochytrium salamandrivorans]KAH6593809.1 hypothetical protein BASA50_007035 [Batrachochytrium salamandrivorans]